MMREQWNIIAKYFAKEELTNSEQEYLSEAKTDNELKNVLNGAAGDMKKVDLYFDLKKIDANSAWDKISGKIEVTKKVVPFRIQLMRIAAIFIFILATGFITWRMVNSNQNNFQTTQNDFSQPEVVLPDGTKVILSHGSKLSYPNKFKGDKRVVELIGEAFFDVMPNAQKPFIIETEKASVRVLGTSFNVYANEASATVEVFVKTGKVELIEGKAENSTANKVLLLPGERGTYEKSSRNIFKEVAAVDNSMAWLTHEIKFNLTNLHDVLATLQRVYNLDVDVEAGIDLNKTITATFDKQDPDYIMEVVAITLDLDLSKTGTNSYRINK